MSDAPLDLYIAGYNDAAARQGSLRRPQEAQRQGIVSSTGRCS